MRQAIWYFLLVAAAATLAWWLNANQGALSLTWLGLRIETSAAWAAVFIGTLMVAGIMTWRAWHIIAVGPEALANLRKRRTARKGQEALARGLIAAAAGNGPDSRKALAQAKKSLPDQPLLWMLEAQSAQASNDHLAAEKAFRRMAKHEETKVLGLRGLFLEARRRGDTTAAFALADRAFHAQPDTPWVFEALFAMHCSKGDWDQALKALNAAERNKLLEPEDAARRRAVVLTAEAMARRAEDGDAAAKRASKARSLAPDFLPAVILEADLQQKFGKTWSAAGIVEEAWPKTPHPGLARVYDAIKPRESDKARFNRFKGLIDLNKRHPESRLLFAQLATRIGRTEVAKDALGPLLKPFPSVRACMLMADIARADGDEGEAQSWTNRAMTAPRDGLWDCDKCGFEGENWTPLCPRCNSFDSLHWKVLGPVRMMTDAAAGMAARPVAEAGPEPAPRGVDPAADVAPATDLPLERAAAPAGSQAEARDGVPDNAQPSGAGRDTAPPDEAQARPAQSASEAAPESSAPPESGREGEETQPRSTKDRILGVFDFRSASPFDRNRKAEQGDDDKPPEPRPDSAAAGEAAEQGPAEEVVPATPSAVKILPAPSGAPSAPVSREDVGLSGPAPAPPPPDADKVRETAVFVPPRPPDDPGPSPGPRKDRRSPDESSWS